MKYRFIAVLHNMELEKIKNKGTRVFNSVRISNSKKILDETIGTNLIQHTLGVHSIREFNNSTYIYIDNTVDLHTKEQMDQFSVEITFRHLRQVQHFTQQLWKIKDNSIYVRDGFVLAYPGNETFEEGWTYKVSLSEVFTFTDCKGELCKFLDEEISEASHLYNHLTELEKGRDYYKEQLGGKLPNADHLL